MDEPQFPKLLISSSLGGGTKYGFLLIAFFTFDYASFVCLFTFCLLSLMCLRFWRIQFMGAGYVYEFRHYRKSSLCRSFSNGVWLVWKCSGNLHTLLSEVGAENSSFDLDGVRMLWVKALIGNVSSLASEVLQEVQAKRNSLYYLYGMIVDYVLEYKRPKKTILNLLKGNLKRLMPRFR